MARAGAASWSVGVAFLQALASLHLGVEGTYRVGNLAGNALAKVVTYTYVAEASLACLGVVVASFQEAFRSFPTLLSDCAAAYYFPLLNYKIPPLN